MNKWHKRFLRIAREISTWSKDPSSQVSAVGVSRDHGDIVVGYNGLPRKLIDDPKILNDREAKLKRIIHAERNLIINSKRSLDGYTIFTFPFMPCSECTSMIIQAGFRKIVSLECDIERWQESFNIAKELFLEASVPLILYKPEQLDE